MMVVEMRCVHCGQVHPVGIHCEALRQYEEITQLRKWRKLVQERLDSALADLVTAVRQRDEYMQKTASLETYLAEADDAHAVTRERLAWAEALLCDMADLISTAIPDSSSWDEEGGLADRYDAFLAAHPAPAARTEEEARVAELLARASTAKIEARKHIEEEAIKRVIEAAREMTQQDWLAFLDSILRDHPKEWVVIGRIVDALAALDVLRDKKKGETHEDV